MMSPVKRFQVIVFNLIAPRAQVIQKLCLYSLKHIASLQSVDSQLKIRATVFARHRSAGHKAMIAALCEDALLVQ